MQVEVLEPIIAIERRIGACILDPGRLDLALLAVMLASACASFTTTEQVKTNQENFRHRN